MIVARQAAAMEAGKVRHAMLLQIGVKRRLRFAHPAHIDPAVTSHG